MKFLTSDNADEMLARYTSDDRWTLAPAPNGSPAYTEELYYDFNDVYWAVDSSFHANRALQGTSANWQGVLFVGNRSGEPSNSPTSGIYLYANAGQLYIKESDGTVRGPITT